MYVSAPDALISRRFEKREKRRSCTNASQWRFNDTTPCVLQTLSFPIRRSHSGHYHLHRHHRRRYNNNNHNNMQFYSVINVDKSNGRH